MVAGGATAARLAEFRHRHAGAVRLALLLLALFLGGVAQEGRIWLAGITTLHFRSGLAGWVAVDDRAGAGAAHEPALARLPGGLPADARRASFISARFSF